MLKISLIVVGLVLATAAPARAQFRNPYTGTTWNNPVSSSVDTMLLHHTQKKMLERSIAAQQGKKAAATVARAPLTASDFVPAKKGRPAVKAFLDSAGLPKDQRAAIEQVIDLTFAAVEKGGRKNNVATAMGIAIGAALMIANGKEIPDDDLSELTLGINDVFAVTAEFKQLDAAARQDIYESLIMTTALLATFHELGTSDAAMKKASVDLAKAVLQKLTGSAAGK
jgi:hypothetical protein